MRATFSKLPLLPKCQWWASDEAVWDDTSSRSADMGNAFHEAMFSYLMGGRPVPLWTKWFTERARHAYRWIDERREATPMIGEVAFALNPKEASARVLGVNIGRRYREHGSQEHELCGSADIVSFDGHTVTVDDWKSGQFVGDDAWLQLRGLGMAAILALNAEVARLRILHATAEGVKERVVMMDRHTMRLEMSILASRLEMVPEAWPNPGAHCADLYCPAREKCTSYQQTRRIGA